ncbi:serine/threonine protein kinase [Amphibacillus sp. Q70]|uniref:serine/threonine protein kinase n=1 Tax=Amphibacillus sp. Q70 TaxID=3453416 RepID=UPI003F8306B8
MLSQKKPTSVFNLSIGSQLVGKWNKQRYVVQRMLGKGAIGAVYLVKRTDGRLVALKISDQIASISSEINVLRKLAKVQGGSPGPSLFEIDDWINASGQSYPFYTMEYVQGERLDHFLRKRGSGWLGVLFTQLLTELEQLHQAGFVLGDLKLENVIVAKNPTRLRFIDVGGVTLFGRAVKEYTEFYDRGYWQCGDRKAEPRYDLFSLAMIALHYAYPNQFKKTKQPKQILLMKLKQSKTLTPYHFILQRALLGRYQKCDDMKKDFQKVSLSRLNKNKATITNLSEHQEVSWIEVIIFTSISLILFVLATL